MVISLFSKTINLSKYIEIGGGEFLFLDRELPHFCRGFGWYTNGLTTGWLSASP